MKHRVNGKSWMYGNKVTKIEGDTIYYVPSTNTATSKNSDIATFDAKAPEESIKKADLLKYESEQGEDKNWSLSKFAIPEVCRYGRNPIAPS